MFPRACFVSAPVTVKGRAKKKKGNHKCEVARCLEKNSVTNKRKCVPTSEKIYTKRKKKKSEQEGSSRSLNE